VASHLQAGPLPLQKPSPANYSGHLCANTCRCLCFQSSCTALPARAQLHRLYCTGTSSTCSTRLRSTSKLKMSNEFHFHLYASEGITGDLKITIRVTQLRQLQMGNKKQVASTALHLHDQFVALEGNAIGIIAEKQITGFRKHSWSAHYQAVLFKICYKYNRDLLIPGSISQAAAMAIKKPTAYAAVAVVLLLACFGHIKAQESIDFSSFDDEADNIDDILYKSLNGGTPSASSALAGPSATLSPSVPAAPATPAVPSAAVPAASLPEMPAVSQPAVPQPTPAPVVISPGVHQEAPSPSVSPSPPSAPAVDELCKPIPGCLSCKPSSSAARKLRQVDGSSGSPGDKDEGPRKGNRPSIDFASFVDSPYDRPNAPYCLACNETAGYTLTTKGRCSECSPIHVSSMCQAGQGA